MARDTGRKASLVSFELGEAFIRVRPQVDEREADRVARRTSDRVARGLDKYGDKTAKAGETMSRNVTLPILAAGGAAIKLASDMTEMEDRTRDVFGKSSGHVIRWSDTMLSRYGIGKDEALDFANVVGNSMLAADVPMKKVLKTQDRAVKRIGDLSSATNASSEEIVDAYSAMLRGEYDPMERFVPGISAATVELQAMRMGLVDTKVDQNKLRIAQINVEKAQRAYNQAVKEHGKNSLEAREADAKLAKSKKDVREITKGVSGELTQQDKILAANALFMKGSENAAGNFARTQDSAANQTRIMKEEAEKLGREFGENLLPITTKVLKWVTRQVKWFGTLDESTQDIIIRTLGIVAAIGPVLFITGKFMVALGQLVKVMGFVGKAFMVLSKLLLANPWVLVAAAVIALAVVIYKNWDKILDFLKKTWKSITRGLERFGDWWSKFWRKALDFVVDLFLNWTVVGRVIKHWDDITKATKKFLKWLGKTWDDFLDWLQDLATKALRAYVGIYTKAWDGITKVTKSFVKWLVNVWENTLDTVQRVARDAWAFIQRRVEAFISTVQKLWGAFRKALTGDWKGAWNDIKGVIDNVRRNIGGWVGKIVNNASSAWSKIKGAFQSPINTVIGYVNRGPIRAWNWVAGKLGWKQAGQIPQLAKGGPLGRYGTGTGDKILGLLDPREFVVPPEMVKAIGMKNLERMRMAALRGKAIQLDGPMSNTTFHTFAEGGLAGGQRVAKRMHGTPYVWGGASWGGADCSGFLSMIINGINGKSGPGRIFATGYLGALGSHGMKRGNDRNSVLRIGVSPPGGMTGAIGHTRGTLGKVAVESGGGHGPAYGPPARGFPYGPLSFSHRKGASPLAGLMDFLGFIPNFLANVAAMRDRGGLYNLFGGIPAKAIKGVKAKARAIVSKPVEWVTGALKRLGSFIFDDGGTLAPGWNTVYNATGRPEPLVPAHRGGGSTIVVNMTVDAARMKDVVEFMEMVDSIPRVARQFGYVPRGVVR